MQHHRLTHPELGYWVDASIRTFDGKWLVAADLADEPDIGTSEEPKKALREALVALGPRLADELEGSADLKRHPHDDVIVQDAALRRICL